MLRRKGWYFLQECRGGTGRPIRQLHAPIGFLFPVDTHHQHQSIGNVLEVLGDENVQFPVALSPQFDSADEEG